MFVQLNSLIFMLYNTINKCVENLRLKLIFICQIATTNIFLTFLIVTTLDLVLSSPT